MCSLEEVIPFIAGISIGIFTIWLICMQQSWEVQQVRKEVKRKRALQKLGLSTLPESINSLSSKHWDLAHRVAMLEDAETARKNREGVPFSFSENVPRGTSGDK